MDESELVQAIKSDPDRFDDLVKRYHPGLIIHCEQLVKNRKEAEDIAQEAFVRAYTRLDQFDPARARFSTWLYKIATNLAFDYLKKHKRQLETEDIEAIAELTMPLYLEEEACQELRTAVATLIPPEYRQVIEAYYWEGKSYQEIADNQNVPLNTVRTWIRRAKAQLKEKLV